jgi:diguanylate cyclase (GGDEF)-like protein
MTRLLSRRRFYELAERDAGPGAMILADIDRFKQINDSHGHGTGDQVIIGVAGRLRAGVHPDDLAGRLGGEEFAIWLPGIALADALALAERLRHAVAQGPLAQARAGPVTISAGLAMRRPGEAMPALIDRADSALYAAKAGGRNCVMLQPDDDAGAEAAPGSADCLRAGTG